MITLYGAEPMWGLPDPSAFVAKTEIHLKMAGLPYQRRWADFGKAPKGKVPYIEDNGSLIPDSTLIRMHLEARHGADFDSWLDDERKGVLWAAEKLCEEHLYWLVVMERWGNPANFEKGPKRFFDRAPALIRPFIIWMIKRKLKASMHGQGVSRYTAEERAMLGAKAFAALAGVIGSRDFAGGDRPCGADATIFAFVQSAACPFFDSVFPGLLQQNPVLMAYLARMEARFYPKA